MKAYLIDELPADDVARIKSFLAERAARSGVEGLYWLRIPDDLLSHTQYAHEGCRPHVCAVEVGADWVKFELLVRSSTTMRCTCPGYCTDPQRRFVIDFADHMISQLASAT